MNVALLHEALRDACENPYWKEYYEEAPTDNCKTYIALGFLLSEAVINDWRINEEEVCEKKKRLEGSFQYPDWKHLLKYSGHNPLRSYYRRMMEQTKPDSTK